MATYAAPTGPAFNDTDRLLIETNGVYNGRTFKEVAEAVAAYNQTVYPQSKLGYAGYAAMTPSAALANSSVLTDVATLTIPANTLAVGSAFKVRARGSFSNTGTPTLTLGVYWGGVAGTALAVTPAITTITGATSWPFEIEAEVFVSAIGASGAMIAAGRVLMPASLTTFQAAYPIDKAAIASVGSLATNASKTLSVGATWGTSSASNTLTVVEAYVSAYNF